MPVELSELLGNQRWVDVTVGDVTFSVAYRPGATSLKRQAELQRLVRELNTDSELDEVEQVEQMGEIFCEMVCGWDLTRQGQPIPVTPETALALPGLIFNAILEAVGQDGAAQGEEKKALSATSGAGSSKKAKRGNARNGTQSSGRRGTWA